MFIASLWATSNNSGWEYQMFIEFSYHNRNYLNLPLHEKLGHSEWNVTKIKEDAFIFESEEQFWDNWETIQIDLSKDPNYKCKLDKILIREVEFKKGYRILEKPIDKS